MSPLIRIVRPKQWIKNAFVFAPLIFSGMFEDITAILSTLLVFVVFCLASSATYVLNDYHDVEKDKKHPIKSKIRPLASGELAKKDARILMIILYAGVLMSVYIEPSITFAIIGYLLLNIAYTFYLKNQPVLDIFTISIGFVLRVYAGAVILQVPLSSWMFITTLSLSLFLASIKRKQELDNNNGDGDTRKVLHYYTPNLVDKYAEMSATCAILFYSLFVMSDKPSLSYTIPFVLFGLYRYWFIVESKKSGESPTDALFSDVPLQITIISWVIACIYYLNI